MTEENRKRSMSPLMPLKHTTETFLAFLLAIVVLLTGVVTATLPDLPAGALPWGVSFVVAILYPIVLLPLFQRRRADHAFRLLHWFPALMLLVWLALQVLGLYQFRAFKVLDIYTWGWTLPAVASAFILLITYCLKVIRRSYQRIALLLLAFVPFTAGAIANEQVYRWNREITATLWGSELWASLEGRELFGFQIAKRLPTEQNLGSSSSSSEETWRERLRLMDRQRRRIEELQRIAGTPPVPQSSASSSRARIATVKTKPGDLTRSGPEAEFLGLMFLAGYTGVLHQRARRRVQKAKS